MFAREHVESMRPHIEKTVNSLIDTLIEKGREGPVDLVEFFSLPVPSYVSPPILVVRSTSHILSDGLMLRLKIIYGLLGVPFKDLEYLTKCNAIRSNGSATATEASNANKYVVLVLYLRHLFLEAAC